MIMKIFLASVYCIFILSFTANGQIQRPDYVPGDLIVVIDKQYTEKEMIATIQGQLPDLTITNFKLISKTMNAWLIQYIPENIDANAALQAVKGIEGVQLAQFNHIGDFRNTVPNDLLFNGQWHHRNTGENGGIEGADVKAIQAWSIATGGLTHRGDTIVVAVIDRGFSLDHEDLAQNLWVNHKEIPGNGIDDDGNGYIDDYHGWNVNAGTGDISGGGSHGTAVNGMVGAVGNNERGVTGINWNVKIMQVSLNNINEARVIEAYEYILNHRIRYNETNGEEGAFVVVTNASWGIDFGRPEDAPLWCNMYDTLGAHGILSVGATANRDINIDVVGDLPTACSSPYLISVTSTDRTDNKTRQAGYGANTIDLGAPGERIFTTNTNNRYSSTSGTSFASPLVAGSIALLYSAPCGDITNSLEEDPAATALMIKDFLIGGVDPNTSLNNITRTGGRLNVHNPLRNIMIGCSTCPMPPTPKLIADLEEAIDLEWESMDIFSDYYLLYRPLGETNWDTIQSVESPFRLENLVACAQYEVSLLGICEEDFSIPSNVLIAKTDGCCEAPRNLGNIFIQPTATRISWRPTLPANEYVIELTNVATGIRTILPGIGNQALIRGLDFCTDYTITMAAICGFTDTTEYTLPLRFRTLGCGACTEVNYCKPTNGSGSDLFITNVVLQNLENESGESEEGYTDFTGDLSAHVEVGVNYNLRVEFENLFETPVNARVWIDFNHNGFFNPDNEVVLTVNGFAGDVINQLISIPNTARQGTTRMRVAVWDAEVNDTIPLVCSKTSFIGEYEDYCVTINPRVCSEVVDIDTVFVGFTQAEFTWTEVEPAISYLYRYKKSSEVEFSKKETTNETTYFLSNLSECTFYDFEVRTICLFDTSAYQRISFETLCPLTSTTVQDIGVAASFSPNPFSDMVQMHLRLQQSANTKIIISDITGRTVYYEDLKVLTTGEHHLIVPNLANWKPGMYIVEVITEHGRITSKLMKH